MADEPAREEWITRLTQYFVILLIAMVAAGLVYGLIASAFVTRRAAQPPPGAACVPSGVTILRPLHGDEPGLVEAIRSVFNHGHVAPVQIIFGVADAEDPALLAIERARIGYPGLDVSVVVSPQRHGANRKMSNIINMEALIRHPVVMIIDSDVKVPRGAVSALAASLADPAVGVGSCLHAGMGNAGFWSRLAAMDITYRFMPSVLVGRGLNLAEPVMGPMMALRSDTLSRVGGFSAFADVLADDYEIGRAVRGLGLRVAVCGPFVLHGCSETGLAALLRHELRWTRTIYGIDRAGFTGSIITHVTPVALLALLLSGGTMGTPLLLLAALALRSAIKLRIDRVSGTVSGPLWLLPLRDCLSLFVYVLTFFVGKVDWRGSRFKVTADGRLLQERQI
ncbi:bacteriohopanetetrol glucosamine biosynthesis glycosyltransferase HpnI [Novosphingobium sp.]|uniref:bacteriohopanetetrol glucosamine biosynthesis glycosyltransferase HpnI n=1 Tax=Novosphingobium sp. TaxID=1874826 RepID=UPI001DDAEE5A|nr:bacteriohopanetetrol glucosamine biosynthesis glycosyltransferase HpnI [Novosphingobium sp.]MBX9664750.1 bacteriohopanetetrol glucosamine biosynthesis glycosyltransferase HpnI [Novosphingobium sp.]